MKSVLNILLLIVLPYSVWLHGQEMVDIGGAIKIEDTNTSFPTPGTIRFNQNTSDFEGWNGQHWMSLTAGLQEGTVTDVEGNSYRTIKIGNQEWMSENLRTKRYRNGHLVTLTQSNSNWENATFGAYCWYNNDAGNDATYGKLYNWHAVADTRGLCPEGWHVASQNDFNVLTTFLNGSNLAGGKMKEIAFWNSPNIGATNTSGFSGLPGGSRSPDGTFGFEASQGWWWSSSSSASFPFFISLSRQSSSLISALDSPRHGMSVRCVKD